MIPEIAPLTREEHALFNELLSKEFGIHFPESKRQILQSRLEPRLRELRLRRFFDYYLKLHYGLEGERKELIHRVTNNETYFFREKGQFDSLFGKALDELAATAPVPGRVRLLSAGCSSGEEPYTLNAYAFDHRFRPGLTEVSVEAFDLDEECLARARAAVYGRRSLRSLTPEQSARYFQEREPGRFLLRRPYRDGVKFRSGNIVDLASFRQGMHYDAIFCRNVLIYFSEGALHRAIDNFAEALRPGGLLFLGHSESIIGMNPKLETVRLESSIVYRRAGS